MQDRGAIGLSASISLHDRQEPAWCRIADRWRRRCSRRQRRRRTHHRRKQQPRHNARTGSHGHNLRWRNCCGCSCWRCSSRRELRHRESWLGRCDRDHAVLQHRRDEAHRRCHEEVRPRAAGGKSGRRTTEGRTTRKTRRRATGTEPWRRTGEHRWRTRRRSELRECGGGGHDSGAEQHAR